MLVAPVAAQEAVPEGYAVLLATPDRQSDITLALPDAAPRELLLAAQEGGAYRLRLTAAEATLDRLDGAQAQRIATVRAALAEGPHTLLLRLRESTIYVLVDGRIVLDALDGTWRGGQLLQPVDGGLSLAPEAYQPAEDILFTDDFMRTEQQQQLGVWQHGRGTWRFYSVAETNPRADVKLSVNPFSLGLRSEDDGPAYVTAGYPFWCDYDAEVSVRSRGGWAGLIACYRGEADYYLLRCDLRERSLRPRRIELVRVKNGAETVLAGGSALLMADQWYRLGIRTRGGRLQCFLDDGPIFDWLDAEASGGPIGLWCTGHRETLFDDVLCETNLEWPLDRGAVLKRSGAPALGEWQFAGPADEPEVGPPVARHLVSPAAGPAVYALGDPAGGPFRLEATVAFEKPGRVGFVYGWRDARNYSYAVWTSADSRLRWGRIVDGTDRPLGLVTDALTPGRPHDVALDLTVPGRIGLRRDGLLRLRAPLDEVPSGRLGLLSEDTAVQFRGLGVRQHVAVDTEVAVDNVNFAGDPYMLNWASSLADWQPVGETANDAMGQQVFWHKGDFYRAYRLTLPPAESMAVLLNAGDEAWRPPSDATALQSLKIVPSDASPWSNGDGYALHFAGTRLVLFRAGVRVTEGELPADRQHLVVGHDGGVTWVEADGTDVLVYHDPDPLPGTRVALRCADRDVLFNVVCRREGVIDEIFEHAPYQWVQQGEWEITNRFSCTPTWSHMAALARGELGALWHKATFDGNVTVEYYAGMRMQVPVAGSGWVGYYPRPGDFNSTVAAKPFDLASGFSLIPGAWDADWSSTKTRYVQGDRLLAETSRPLVPRTREDQGQRYIDVPYIRAGRDVHGAWYYVKNRFVDGWLRGSFDNVPVLEAEAPQASGNHVAVWTQENEIMVARVRITYEGKRIPCPLVDAPAAEPGPDQLGVAALQIAEAPGLAYDFDASPQGWGPRDATSRLLIQSAEVAGRRCLRVENPLPGGSFEVAAPIGRAAEVALGALSIAKPESQAVRPLDLSRAAVLRFDYAIPPATRINLYLTIGEQRYSVPLTGPADDDAVLPVLLRAEGIVADGRWHACRLPLGAALRQAALSAPVLNAMSFGMAHQGYLCAGFAGNPSGAWYAIDNLAIVPEVAPGSALTPSIAAAGAFGTAVALAGDVADAPNKLYAEISPRPDAAAPGQPLAGPLAAPSGAGVVYVTARARFGESDTATFRQPVLVADATPPLRAVDAGLAWDGGPVRVAFGDSAPTEVAASIVDTPVPASGIRVDAAARQVVIDPAGARLAFTDGQAVAISIHATFATGATSALSVERRYQRAADRLPPLPPRVTGLGPYWDFEHGNLPIRGNSARIAVAADRSTASTAGGTSARVTNLDLGGSFFDQIGEMPVDLARNPVLMFDYRVAEPVRFDLIAVVNGNGFTVPMFDHSGQYPTLTSVAEAQRDGTWHRATLDLQPSVLAHAPFAPNMYRLLGIGVADSGYSGAAPGATHWIDEVRFVSVVPAGAQAGLDAYDAGGIAAWRTACGTDEALEPTAELPGDATAVPLDVAAEGLHWLAVQCRDAAGNWSRVTRLPYIVDLAAPAFGGADPAPGPLGRWDLSVPVQNLGPAALNPASLKLTVNGSASPVVPGLVRFDAGSATLAWDWAYGRPEFAAPVADGTPVSMTLEGSDSAGQAAGAAALAYQVSYAADQQPPLSPELTLAEQPLEAIATFTTGLGGLSTIGGALSSPVQVLVDPETSDRVAEVTSNGTGRYLQTEPFDLAKTPYISFDYKLGEGAVLHLQVYINGTYYSVALNGRSASYPALGELAVTADGHWHTLVLDLLTMAKSQIPSAERYQARYLALVERGSSGGAKYRLDNVAIFGGMPAALKASWTAYDATGIAGSAVSLQQDLAAAPPDALLPGAGTAELSAGGTGTWLLQVRARDGAGNWGAAARRIVVVQ